MTCQEVNIQRNKREVLYCNDPRHFKEIVLKKDQKRPKQANVMQCGKHDVNEPVKHFSYHIDNAWILQPHTLEVYLSEDAVIFVGH